MFKLSHALGIALIIGLAGAVFAFATPRSGSLPSDKPVSQGFEQPYSLDELRADFASDADGFGAVRSFVRALPHEQIAMQTDYFSWGEPGHSWFWRPDTGLWGDSDRKHLRKTGEVLTEVGVTLDAYTTLCVFLARHGYFAVHRITDETAGVSIQFKPRRGLWNSETERFIVWHEDLQPITPREWDFLPSETTRIHQRATEIALPRAGWFVRSVLPTAR